MVRSLIFFLMALGLSACVSQESVQPRKGDRLTQLCIEENPEVAKASFLPMLVSMIEERGIRATRYSGQQPDWCPEFIRYTADWSQGLFGNLAFAQINLFEGKTLKGSARYFIHGSSFDQFGSDEGKIQPLIEKLFP